MLDFTFTFGEKIYTPANIPRNTTVRLPHPRREDSQDQETFLAPSADKQISNYNTDSSDHLGLSHSRIWWWYI